MRSGMLGTAIGARGAVAPPSRWRAGATCSSPPARRGLVIFLAALFFLREPHSPAADGDDARRPNICARASPRSLGNPRTWAIAIDRPALLHAGQCLWRAVGHDRTDQGPSPFRGRRPQTAVSMIFWGMAAGSVAGGWLSDRLGHRKYLVFAGAVLTGAGLWRRALSARRRTLDEGVLLFAAGFFGGTADADLRHGQGRPGEPRWSARWSPSST